MQSPFIDSPPPSPLSNRQRLALKREPLGVWLVVVLNLFRGPAAVVRLVVSVIVNSVQRLLAGSGTHVRQEILERFQPAVTHGNAPTTITKVGSMARVKAAGLHPLPDLILSRLVGVVRAVSRRCRLFLVAAAGYGIASTEFLLTNVAFSSTVATAEPRSPAAFYRRNDKDCHPSTKSLAESNVVFRGSHGPIIPRKIEIGAIKLALLLLFLPLAVSAQMRLQLAGDGPPIGWCNNARFLNTLNGDTHLCDDQTHTWGAPVPLPVQPVAIPTDPSHRWVADSEKLTWNNKQNALGFVPVNPSSLSTVATTGSYSDLSGKPTPSGYTLFVQALTSSPVDAQTIYFGMLPKAPIATANVSKVYIREAGTIKRAEIYAYAGTAGTAESWTISIRKNNTTDTTIATVAAGSNERVFSNTALSISVVNGDYIEIKSVNPTWATNPLTLIMAGYVYIERP